MALLSCFAVIVDFIFIGSVYSLSISTQPKHDNNANVTGSYAQSPSRMCFKRDNTSTGGGFEVKYGHVVYRIEIWATGFYDITRKIKGVFQEDN